MRYRNISGSEFEEPLPHATGKWCRIWEPVCACQCQHASLARRIGASRGFLILQIERLHGHVGCLCRAFLFLDVRSLAGALRVALQAGYSLGP